MARIHWHYSGDISIENGGTFYDLSNWHSMGYATALRVVPCSDAGGPDNEFWLEELTVNRQYDDKVRSAIDTIGMRFDHYENKSKAQQAHILFDACLSYGFYDQLVSKRIRIGKAEVRTRCGWDHDIKPDEILRGNVSLDRYVRKCLNGTVEFWSY